MKRTLLFIALLIISVSAYAQTASRLLAGQSKPYRTLIPDNILWVDTLAGGEYRIYAISIDSIRVKAYQLKWLQDSIKAVGDLRYPQLAGSYSNPPWVNSLSVTKVFGLSSVATSGLYSDLTGNPNLGLYYLASNPNGYISGINSSLVIGALGYTPTNPNGTNAQYTAGDGSKITFPTIPTNTSISI